jgi:hypothetical protein
LLKTFQILSWSFLKKKKKYKYYALIQTVKISNHFMVYNLPMIGFESFCNRVQNKGNAGRVGQQFSQLRAEKT